MMFVGPNELHLNQATMMLALQHWLEKNTVHVPAARVVGVKQVNDEFIVMLTTEQKKP